jgi:hypothetical protein
MAMFPTHIKTSTCLGIGCGAIAHFGYGVPLTTSIVGAGLCSVGGILPDIDSGPGIPLREITTFLASVVPTMLITRLLSYSFTQETLILAGAAIYIGIRFGLSHFLRHYTVHRGMFHSIPSMAIFGELTYLLFYGESMFVRLFMVAAVCLGFFSHLLLDEIYSVEWDGRPHLKNSFGTAIKFYSREWWPNFTCYAKLTALSYLVMNDPSVIQQVYTGQSQQVAKNLGQAVKDGWDLAVAKTGSKPSGNGSLLDRLGLGSTKGVTTRRPVAASSSTVPPPSLLVPSAETTGQSKTAVSSPMAVPSTPYRADPADPSLAGRVPASVSPAFRGSSPPTDVYQPENNQPRTHYW